MRSKIICLNWLARCKLVCRNVNSKDLVSSIEICIVSYVSEYIQTTI